MTHFWGSIRHPAFGRAINSVARRNHEGVVVTLQSCTRVAGRMAPSVELTLRRAGVDYFDVLQLGSWNKPPGPGLIEAAERLKEMGRVRHLMMSTHNRPSLQDHRLRASARPRFSSLPDMMSLIGTKKGR